MRSTRSTRSTPPAPLEREKPVLIVLHQETSTPGRVGLWLTQHGYPLDIRRPPCGDPLPQTLAAHTGAIIFGGPMSANDDDEAMKQETLWLDVPLGEEKPFLGICLGAQLLARAIGGTVTGHPDGLVEVGYYPITPSAAGKALFSWPGFVYQWHREGFTLPACATVLAEGQVYPLQAYRYGPAAFGIQFHPEVTLQMMHRWTIRGAERMALPGACGERARHISDRRLYDASVAVWLDVFMRYWLSGTGSSNALF